MRVGIDLGGTKIEGILMDESGVIVGRERVDTPTDYASTLLELKGLVNRLDSSSSTPSPVGMGTPGAWVESERAMKNSNSTCLNGKPFLDDIKKVLGRPVRIQNDANCFALSEAVDGAGAGSFCVFGVILGTGCGGGWVVDGKLITGPNSLSGEWGHNPFPKYREDPVTAELESLLSDRECHCGQTNCVECFVSGTGLELSHRELTGDILRGREIAKLGMCLTVDLYISQLARSLAVIVNAIDPDVIVLGGGVSNMTEIYEELPDRLQSYACKSGGKTQIRPAKHSDSSGVRGAAWLFPK